MILPYPFEQMTREQLLDWLQDAAKLWLAHDGLWFQAVENDDGMTKAMAHDAAAWRRFSPIEARRIMKRLGIEPGGGLDALIVCLQHRLYGHLNEQEVSERTPQRVVFRMRQCRVQNARRRKGSRYRGVRDLRPHHRPPHPLLLYRLPTRSTPRRVVL